MMSNRKPTDEEMHLSRWMLMHGDSDFLQFLTQLDHVQVTPERCPCGCASLRFEVQGMPVPSGPVSPIADFVFGPEGDTSGIFIFEQGGTLAGLEVYGLSGDAPKFLPSPERLRPAKP